jgi:hypothetical protein
MGKGKDIGMMLIAGLKKKKGAPVEDEGDEDEDLSSDDGPEYDPGRKARVKAASAILAAKDADDAEALADALETFHEAWK